jgi:plasmid stabilization system protein ParE
LTAHVARTRKAKQDLREIVQHIVLDNPTAAMKWVDGLESVFRLERFPNPSSAIGEE